MSSRGHLALILTVAFLALHPGSTPPLAQEAPEGPPQAHTDLHGDPIPEGAILRLGSRRFRHNGDVLAVAYSPDGKTVLSGGMDGVARLWDAATGKEIRFFEAGREVSCVAFSPDGKVIATGGGGGGMFGFPLGSVDAIFLWDATTGKRLHALGRHKASVHSVTFSPDGKRIAAATGDRDEAEGVYLWDVSSGTVSLVLEGHEKGIFAVAFAPDGKTLASGSWDESLRFWDLMEGKEVLKLEVHDVAFGLAYSPDGKLLASAHDEAEVCLWDVSAGKEIRTLEGPRPTAYTVAFSPDGGTVAAGGEDGSLRLWEVDTGKILKTLEPPVQKGSDGGALHHIAFSPDGKTLAAAGPWAVIRFWDIAKGQLTRWFGGHERFVCSVAFSPDGEMIATGGGDRTVRLWSRGTGKETWKMAGHELAVRSVAFSPDGKTLASASGEGSVRLWEAPAGEGTHTWKVTNGRGRVTIGIGGRRGTIRLYPGSVTAIAFSADGGKTVAAGEDSIHLLDLKSKKKEPLWQTDEIGIGIHMLLHGRGWDDRLGRQDLMRYPWEETAAVSRDGRTIVLRSRRTAMRAWDVEAGESRILIGAPTEEEEGVIIGGAEGSDIVSLTLSPDARSVASADADGTVHLWELVTGSKIRDWAGHDDIVTSMAFSPDGRILATSSIDHVIRLWDPTTGKRLKKLRGHDEMVFCVAFSPDGEMLASGSLDSTALLWDVRDLAEKLDERKEEIFPEKLDELWKDLAGGDATAAYEAISVLAAAPEKAIPLLQERLRPSREVDADRVEALISRLDHDEYAVREKASAELRDLGAAAEPILRKALEGSPSPEVRSRITAVLDSLKLPFTRFPSERLRRVRAMQVLERIGTAEAAAILRGIADRSASPRERADATAALHRLP